jgi:hypothetical protein
MAVMTVTTTAPQDARLVAAFGNKLGLGRPATAAEIKADIIAYITRCVAEDEARMLALAANPNPFTPT